MNENYSEDVENVEAYWKLLGHHRRSEPHRHHAPLRKTTEEIETQFLYLNRFMTRPVAEQPSSWIWRALDVTIQPTSIGREAQSTLHEKVADLEREVKDLRERVDLLESHDKRHYLETNWFEIVATIESVFSPLGFVKSIYCEKTDSGCDLTFVYEMEDKVMAQEKILERTAEIEDKYPKLAFDYLILKTNEVRSEELASEILLYSR